jgi:predicted thioesterase
MMDFGFKKGDQFTIQREALPEDDASRHGTGRLKNVLSTPALVSMMIEAAAKYMDSKLEDEFVSVGKVSKVSHEKAALIGEAVSVKVVVSEVDGNRVVFDMEAFDEIGKIGSGEHERYVVSRNALETKAKKRAESLENKDF